MFFYLTYFIVQQFNVKEPVQESSGLDHQSKETILLPLIPIVKVKTEMHPRTQLSEGISLSNVFFVMFCLWRFYGKLFETVLLIRKNFCRFQARLHVDHEDVATIRRRFHIKDPATIRRSYCCLFASFQRCEGR